MASGIRHGSSDRGVDALTRRRARASAAEIAETLRRRADHGLSPPVTGPLSGLTDVLVHGADMRIPLGLPHLAGSAACRPGARFPDESNAARLLPAPTPAGYRITRRGHWANVGRRRIDPWVRRGGDVGGVRTHRRARPPRRPRVARAAIPAYLIAVGNSGPPLLLNPGRPGCHCNDVAMLTSEVRV